MDDAGRVRLFPPIWLSTLVNRLEVSGYLRSYVATYCTLCTSTCYLLHVPERPKTPRPNIYDNLRPFPYIPTTLHKYKHKHKAQAQLHAASMIDL